MPFIVATYVYASSQGQHKHSARTKSNAFPLWVDSTVLSKVHELPLGSEVTTINSVLCQALSKAKDLGWPYFQFIQTSTTHQTEK
jgi:hypothetical protein